MFVKSLVVAESVDSTNDSVRKLPTGTILLANTQSQGRGRHSKQWFSPTGNLYFSHHFGMDCSLYPIESSFLPIIAAIATHQIISRYHPLQSFSIKWPNDILTDKGKVSGILLEQYSTNHYILGIGINLIPQNQATSNIQSYDYLHTSKQNKEAYAIQIINKFFDLIINKSFEDLEEYFFNYSFLQKGQVIKSSHPKQIQVPSGKLLGLLPTGEILLQSATKRYFSLNNSYSINY